ncbi:MAG: hypothetical protein ABSA71_09610 [Desulfomonilia bacterium]|jgi:hypothetical protein
MAYILLNFTLFIAGSVLYRHMISGSRQSKIGAFGFFSVHPWIKAIKIIVFFVDKRDKAPIIVAVAW